MIRKGVYAGQRVCGNCIYFTKKKQNWYYCNYDRERASQRMRSPISRSCDYFTEIEKMKCYKHIYDKEK